MPVFREHYVIANDVQVGDSGHDLRMGVRIVEGRYKFSTQTYPFRIKIESDTDTGLKDCGSCLLTMAVWESCRSGEGGFVLRRTEVRNAGATFVVFR